LTWWRNEGGNPPNWTRVGLDYSFKHVMSVDAQDIDGDGYPDVIATSWDRHQMAWWKNPGSSASGWTSQIVLTDFINAHDGQGGDIDDDGDTDIAAVSSSGEVVVCYHDGNVPVQWNTQTLNSSFGGGKTIRLFDLDRDGDDDLVGTAADDNLITWWENQGGSPVIWAEHPIVTGFVGSSGIDIIDFNGDGSPDIIGAAWKSGEVSLWLCEALGEDRWTEIPVTDALEVAANVRGCDFDRDGQIDIAAVGKIPGELSIYFNDDLSWMRQTLISGFEGGTALSVIDMDDDGDGDFFAGASAQGRLSWWENRSIR
jgi:hypothetical protein